MKNLISILILLFLFNPTYSQTISVVSENPDNSQCRYDLLINGESLTKISNCVFQAPPLNEGETYELEIVAHPNSTAANNINNFDLVYLFQTLSGINQIPLHTYLSDIDQDGSVSTYDLLKLRAIILFEDLSQPIYHVIKANKEIPEIDKFDIQVDYSTLLFTSEDFNSDIMEIRVLQLGNLDNE